VRWDLLPAGAHGVVAVLSASVIRLAAVDRLLLALGGRVWIRRLFVATLDRLAAELRPPVKAPSRTLAPGGVS